MAGKALGTTHGLATLRPGMKVTCYLRVPLQERARVRFFAYDSKSTNHWAPETPEGGEAQLAAGGEPRPPELAVR